MIKPTVALTILLVSPVFADDFSNVVDRAVQTFYKLGAANVAMAMNGPYYCEQTIAFAMYVDMVHVKSGLPSERNPSADSCIKRGHVKANYVYAMLGSIIIQSEPQWIK